MMVRGKHGCSKCKKPLRITEAMQGVSPCCQAEIVQTEAPPRPMFKNVWDMNKTIIDNHNEFVGKGDIVYELGDLFLKINAKIARETRHQMKGNFYFVNGNHDQVAEQIPDCFVWMKDLVRIKPAGFETPHITLCHYAMRTWHGSHKGVWQLYGHSHGQLPEENVCPNCHHCQPQWLSFDVGVDANNFYPVSIETVIKRMKEKIPRWEAWRDSLKNRHMGL
jgi:calcineurin-like phosphoesterase family protein